MLNVVDNCDFCLQNVFDGSRTLSYGTSSGITDEIGATRILVTEPARALCMK